MKALQVEVYMIDHEDDLVAGIVNPKLSAKPSTIITMHMQYLVETHLDPSGVFAYVNLSTGQVFTTSPAEHARIVKEMGFECKS